MTNVDLHNRAWILGLVVIAYWAGLRPLSKQNAHALVFLANSLAPIYDDAGIETRVIKHKHGPFYPDAQWDLDRMVGQGLLSIHDVHLSKTEENWWLDAAYIPTAAGRNVFSRCRELPLLKRSTGFLVELVNAFASLSAKGRDQAALKDAIYAIPGRPNLSPLVFENIEDNYSTMTANAFEKLAGSEISLSPKERLQLYFGYLAHRVETTGGQKS
ncbi:TPA: hypothetical protein QDC59_001924 [Burkholderia cenocepacia]|nr:hypothetical protein [Burkholderia cenocepacia]